MAYPRKLSYKLKHLAKIFYASRVAANFVLNFVAMATEVGRGKLQLAAFDGPSPKPPYRRKNLAKISYANQVIANFVPNFVGMATEVLTFTITFTCGESDHISGHPALRPLHGPSAQPLQTSRSTEFLRSFRRLQEEKPMEITTSLLYT